MKHKYQCEKGHMFIVDDSDTKFDHEPKTRKCKKCKRHPLMYLGTGTWDIGHRTDSTEVKSMADGKTYTSKAKYYRSLKDNGSHVTEKGEFKNKPRETVGDFDCRKELTQAVYRHLH